MKGRLAQISVDYDESCKASLHLLFLLNFARLEKHNLLGKIFLIHLQMLCTPSLVHRHVLSLLSFDFIQY